MFDGHHMRSASSNLAGSAFGSHGRSDDLFILQWLVKVCMADRQLIYMAFNRCASFVHDDPATSSIPWLCSESNGRPVDELEQDDPISEG